MILLDKSQSVESECTECMSVTFGELSWDHVTLNGSVRRNTHRIVTTWPTGRKTSWSVLALLEEL